MRDEREWNGRVNVREEKMGEGDDLGGESVKRAF